MKHLLKILLLTVASLSAPSAISQSNIVSGLIYAADSVEITAFAWIEPEKGEQGAGKYEIIYQESFLDSYTFKIGAFRDITIIFDNGNKRKMMKIIEGGISENFHEIDVHFNRATSDLAYKYNASGGQFKTVTIRTRY